MNNEISNDQFDKENDHVLAVSSLFMGNFSIDWIQELTQLKASQVLSIFEKAVNHGFLTRGDVGTFSFSQGKIIKQFQAKLFPNEKKRYNQLIAAILIKELPDTPEKAELIAPHLLTIFNDIEGCKLLMKAAKSYRSNYRIEAAIKCYIKILEDLSGLYQEGSDKIFCDAAIEYAKLNTARNDVKYVISILEEAMFRAKNLKDQRYESMIDMNIAKNKWMQSQYKNALNHFESSRNRAQELGDEKLIRSIANFKTFLLYWQGLFKEAVVDYEKYLTDVENFPFGRFPLLAAMTVGTCYGQIGQITQGIGMIDSIRRQCLENGDIGLAAHSGIIIGAIMLDIGHVDDALQHLVPSIEEARKLQPDWSTIQGELMLAYAYYLKDERDKCIFHISQFYKLSKQVDVSVRPWPYLMELCWAIEEGRLPSHPEMYIRQEVDAMINGENVFLKGVAYRFKALLQKKDGASHDQVIETLNKSIEYLEVSGHAIELAKTRLELARLYLLRGQQKQALHTAEIACNVLSSFNTNLIPDDLKPLIKSSTANDNQFKELIVINKELRSINNSKDMIQYIISTANRIAGAERGGIFLLDDLKPPYIFKLRASKNLTQDQVCLPEFKSSLKLINEVVACGEGKVQDARIQENSDSPEEEVILSSICVPVIIRKQILGVLYNDNRLLSNAFHRSLLEILSSLAYYAALVLENDKLHKENDCLLEKIEKIKNHYEKQNTDYQPTIFENIIGESPEIKRVLSQIDEIAQSDTTVLILGETGVGKELVAKAILNNSSRKNKPFITLNCSALSENLVYSELFGHEKGSFTGADRRHIGRFEKAHGGTLFLDEIGDLTQDMQVKLLRTLETKEFERVGGKETRRSEFRLITATNRNLEQNVKKKLFRADLFYRINVFPIYVPPLRERRQDIPLLIKYFLNIWSTKTGKISRIISDEEMAELTRYDWPGNVRELKNCVERYVTSSRTSITNLLNWEYQTTPIQKHSAVTLQDNERQHIEWALEKTMGKIHGPGGAAELLDIHPNTLTFRIKKLGIKKQRRSQLSHTPRHK